MMPSPKDRRTRRKSTQLAECVATSVKGPATHIRGIAILGSFAALRSYGVADQYWSLVDHEEEVLLRSVVSNAWVPMEIATAHYARLDRLITDKNEQRKYGQAAGRRAHGIFTRTVVRRFINQEIVRNRMLEMMVRRFAEQFRGGSMEIFAFSESHVRIEIYDIEFLKFEYVKNAFAGHFEGALSIVENNVGFRRLFTPDQNRLPISMTWIPR